MVKYEQEKQFVLLALESGEVALVDIQQSGQENGEVLTLMRLFRPDTLFTFTKFG